MSIILEFINKFAEFFIEEPFKNVSIATRNKHAILLINKYKRQILILKKNIKILLKIDRTKYAKIIIKAKKNIVTLQKKIKTLQKLIKPKIKPTTMVPTTMVSTTMVPTTMVPTIASITNEPTTITSITNELTTKAPTIKEVTTITATTIAPTIKEATTMAPTTKVPTTMAPTTKVPTTMAPTTKVPTTKVPTTMSPTTMSPTTMAPTTKVPTTMVPTTMSQTTMVQTTAQTTNAPTTMAQTTNAPTTYIPTTIAPSTNALTTYIPTTIAPTTNALTTYIPTTMAQTTMAQTTMAQTTNAQTTMAQTTMAQTTMAQTTNAPTTISETTNAPTTMSQTTNALTTMSQTTNAPTTMLQLTSFNPNGENFYISNTTTQPGNTTIIGAFNLPNNFISGSTSTILLSCKGSGNGFYDFFIATGPKIIISESVSYETYNSSNSSPYTELATIRNLYGNMGSFDTSDFTNQIGTFNNIKLGNPGDTIYLGVRVLYVNEQGFPITNPQIKVQIIVTPTTPIPTTPIPIPTLTNSPGETLQVITKFTPSVGDTSIQSMIFDSSGQNIYFTTYKNCTVYKMTYPGGIVTSFSAIGSALSPNMWGICQDLEGNIYTTSNYSEYIYKITPDGTATRFSDLVKKNFGGGVFSICKDGYMYTTSRSSIKRIGKDAWARTFLPKFTDGSTANFSNNLSCVALSPDGNFYAVDCNAHRIVKIKLQYIDDKTVDIRVAVDGDAITFVGSTSGIVGHKDGTGTEALLSFPFGMVIDADGNLYITEVNNFSCIRKITPAGVVTTVAGSGIAGHSDGLLFSATLSSPSITIGPDGNLWITNDGGFIRQIQMIPPVRAQPLYSFNGLVESSAPLQTTTPPIPTPTLDPRYPPKPVCSVIGNNNPMLYTNSNQVNLKFYSTDKTNTFGFTLNNTPITPTNLTSDFNPDYYGNYTFIAIFNSIPIGTTCSLVITATNAAGYSTLSDLITFITKPTNLVGGTFNNLTFQWSGGKGTQNYQFFVVNSNGGQSWPVPNSVNIPTDPSTLTPSPSNGGTTTAIFASGTFSPGNYTMNIISTNSWWNPIMTDWIKCVIPFTI